MRHRFYKAADLVDRLCYAANRKDREVIFLVGSPISRPDHVGGHGVPDVSGMIDLIRDEFKDTEAEAELDGCIKGTSGTPYQGAFEFLHGRRGQDVVNRIVRTAVWQALNANGWPSFLPETAPHDADAATCKALEREVDAWTLPRAVDLFGHLLVTCADTFGGAVLTTNFDPLLEVSVLKHGGRHYRTVLHGDGRLGQTVAEGTHIVHLHGYWWGYDTLHTPQQLVQPRPQLRQSLARIVKASTLVILGYGGWDDVITQTLVDLLTDQESNPEIMWAFHGDDAAEIETSQATLMATLDPGIGRGRVLLYSGIDCCSLLSDIHDQLKPSYPAASGSSMGAPGHTLIREAGRGGLGSRQVRIEIDLPMTQLASADPDRPLFVTPWVGRDQELSILERSDTAVAFITGLGGQGKSALAGEFLKRYAMSPAGRFEFWDWRDCREESDRLNTLLLRLIERLSDGAMDASGIESTDIRAVVGILFRVLKDRRALLIFDNVDQYVDLESFEPVKGLDVLVSEAQARSHRSLFIFTCRPDVRVDESRAMRLTLAGLTGEETRELIATRGVRTMDLHLAEELHGTTDGHPLWINLIVMQAIRRNDGLRGALDLIGRGAATLPDTTRTIWGMLNEQQRTVLRTMAELDRPEPENRLLDLLPGANANRVNRALRALRSFHLIETRTQVEGEPLLGLHPIIREFVRTSFPRKDREKYVGAILGFLDRMIGRFQGLLQKEPSYEILEHWTRKADLQIAIGRFEAATSTIAEIGEPLSNRGYMEEMVRVTMRLFAEIDWADACSSYKDFDTVFERCLTIMIQTGHTATNELLARYAEAIPGKSAQFILLCDLRCYANWYSRRFESAIHWGEEGDRLKADTAADTAFSTRHNLALSRRDGGRVSEGLESFLDGESLEAVVKPGERIADRAAHFYGNIGRCLFLTGKLDDALNCYLKSAQILEEGRSRQDRLNKGYIRKWIGELLLRQGRVDVAAASYRGAVCMWEESSPPRAEEAEEELEKLVAEHPECGRYVDEVDWKVEEEYARWLSQQ